MKVNDLARITDKIVIDDNDCWKWQGAKTYSGYSVILDSATKTTRSGHRLFYELWNETTVSADLDVGHTCDNRDCLNPDHLVLQTRSENMLQASANISNSKSNRPRCTPVVISKATDSSYRAISFPSAATAAEYLDVNKSSISSAIAGNQPTVRGWRVRKQSS